MTELAVIELDLTGIAHGGAAVGRHEGRVVFAAYGLPGERVRVRLTQEKARFAHGEVVEVLHAAPERVTPRCPHFGPGACGGCQWQHIAYERQLTLKQQIVREQLERLGRFTDIDVLPTIPAPDPWAYRAHITLRLTPEGRPAFTGTDGHSLIPIDECHIIQPALAEGLQRLAEGAGEAARLRVQAGDDGAAQVFPLAAGAAEPDEAPAAGAGAEPVFYTLHGKRLRCSPGSFFQVNPAQAARLVDEVVVGLALQAGDRVLDLYAGVGLFTAFIAEQVRAVTAVEAAPGAAADLAYNLRDRDNVQIVAQPAERAVHELPGRWTAAVVDPPRAGMDESVLKWLVKRARPRRLVLVACDPAALARDARRLADAGYALQRVQPMDMFPQTYHIETVAVFASQG